MCYLLLTIFDSDYVVSCSHFVSPSFPTLAVHAKSIVAILHLLVALSQHFRAPIRLPDHVSIQVVVVQVSETLALKAYVCIYF